MSCIMPWTCTDTATVGSLSKFFNLQLLTCDVSQSRFHINIRKDGVLLFFFSWRLMDGWMDGLGGWDICVVMFANSLRKKVLNDALDTYLHWKPSFFFRQISLHYPDIYMNLGSGITSMHMSVTSESCFFNAIIHYSFSQLFLYTSSSIANSSLLSPVYWDLNTFAVRMTASFRKGETRRVNIFISVNSIDTEWSQSICFLY